MPENVVYLHGDTAPFAVAEAAQALCVERRFA